MLIRNVRLDDRTLDLRLSGGRIAEIGHGLSGEELFDARGGAVIRGLNDHHIHLFAWAAARASLQLDDVRDRRDLEARLRKAAQGLPPGAWIRAAGLHDGACGDVDAATIDTMVRDHPVRIQHRSGALWILNTLALGQVMTPTAPAGVERDGAGAPTGRLWRVDDWLSARLSGEAPDLTQASLDLASFGVCGVTDASATNGPSSADALSLARRSGVLRQKLRLMGRLDLPPGEAYQLGELKLLLDEADLPDFAEALAQIQEARRCGRASAFHCVTPTELAFALALLEAAGPYPGDRIEHASLVPEPAIGQLARMGLTVVTQPAFVLAKGERYLDEVPPEDLPDLYRLSSLQAAGVGLAASSDAPYGPADPWQAIRAASERRSAAGRLVGPAERIDVLRALRLYQGPLDHPAEAGGHLHVGSIADFCILHGPLDEMLDNPQAAYVAATLVDGELVWRA